MTLESGSRNGERSRQEMLPLADKETIHNGLLQLAHILTDKPPEDLPELVLYLDTSARPLFYAVNPVLKKVYDQKREKNPSALFFQSFSGQAFIDDRGNERRYETAEYQQRALEERIETSPYKDDPKKHEELIALHKDGTDYVNQRRALMAERAAQILQSPSAKNVNRILVVDDYPRTERVSLFEVFRALRKVRPEIQMMGFSFLTGIPVSDKSFFTEEEWNEWANPAPQMEGLEVHIGMTDPNTGYNTPRGPIFSTPRTCL